MRFLIPHAEEADFPSASSAFVLHCETKNKNGNNSPKQENKLPHIHSKQAHKHTLNSFYCKKNNLFPLI